MILEFAIAKTGLSGSSHYLSGRDDEDWRIELKEGLNELSEQDVQRLQGHPSINWYLSTGAIKFREEPETSFGRLIELEQLYQSQGYQAIASIAQQYGIGKPATGWKDAIALIMEYEKELLM